MLRLEADRVNAVLGIHLNRFCCGLYGNNILCLDIRLGLFVLGGLHVHDFYGVGFFTVLFDQCAGECHFHHAAPDLVVQLSAVGIQKIDIVGKGCDNFFLLTRFCGLGFHVLFHHVFDSGYHAGFCCHTCRKNTFICMNVNNSSVFHGQLSVKCRMLSRLRHHHINALLLSHSVHCVPCGLGTVLIVCDGVSSQLFAVCQHSLHCVADLVLYTKIQILAVFHASGAVHDSRGSLGSDGIFHLPAFHVVQSMQLIQRRSIDLCCAAPADSNDIAVAGLRRILNLGIRRCRSLRGSCRRNSLCRFGSFLCCRFLLCGNCGLLRSRRLGNFCVCLILRPLGRSCLLAGSGYQSSRVGTHGDSHL